MLKNNPDVWIAFEPQSSATYGAFIAEVGLAPIDVKKLWSGQFLLSDANQLPWTNPDGCVGPGKANPGRPNYESMQESYIMVGADKDDHFQVTVFGNLPTPSVSGSKVKYALARFGPDDSGSTPAPFQTYSSAGSVFMIKVNLDRVDTSTYDKLRLVAVWDKNVNGIDSSDEVIWKSDFYVKSTTQVDYDSGYLHLLALETGGWLVGHQWAKEFLGAFLGQGAPAGGSTIDETMSVNDVDH